MAIAPLPLNSSFEDWGNQLILDLVPSGYLIPLVPSLENWRMWANQLIFDNRLDAKVPLPTLESYPENDDWRKWASFFVDSINT